MVPAPLESAITSSPLVRDAVVFGRGRNQVGVLIEAAVPVFDVVEFRNRIWCALVFHPFLSLQSDECLESAGP